MAWQPNPFVDPNQRGFELPAGCKDLHDVLARVGAGQLIAPSRVEAGGIGTINLDAAQGVIDLLIRGYGLPENARLLFHYQEQKDQMDP